MITFRPLVAGDLPTMHRWLQDPQVVHWWEGDDVTWAGVLDTYGTPGGDPEDHFMALLDGRPFGWCQSYRLADVEEDIGFFAPLGLDPATTASIDYLIGSPADRGRGLGGAMIRAFVEQELARHPAWRHIVVAPQRANEASWRCLESAGFERGPLIADPVGPCQAMVLSRPPVL